TYTPLSSFFADAESGLSSSTFDLSSNISSLDNRAGLDDAAKTEIMAIMKGGWFRRPMGFDEARRVYMERMLEREGIGRDGRPRDPKFVSLGAVGLLEGHVIVLVNDHVAIQVIHDDVAGSNDLLVLDLGEGGEDLGDVAPPLLAERLVPLDGDANALLERGLLVPAEVAQLGAVDGVAAVVEGAVVGVLDPLVELLLGLVGDLEVGEELGAEGQVGDLVVGTDVVDLADGTLVEDGVKGVGGVTGEQVTAGGGAVTVENDGLAAVQEAGEFRDDLWGRYVVAADDDDGELETLLVRVHQHLGGGLGGGVGVGGGEDAGLEEVIILILNLTVDLIGGDVDEALDADLLGRLEQDVGAVDVGVGETVRVSERQVNVGLGGEVEDGVNVVALKAVHHLGGVGDVALVEGEVPLVIEGAGVVERSTVVELVKGDNVVCLRVCDGQVSYQPASTAER
ncbi:hypothetical protein V494_01461, partial [Pseudogymnoascus sp. VKM F-4513 (FW-928)]